MITQLLNFVLLCAICLCTGVNAKIPGSFYVAARGGILFPGIASDGTAFIGRALQFGLAYRPMPDAAVGFQLGFGFQINSYRHNFEKNIFITHIQRGFSTDLLAVMKAGEHIHILTGFEAFTPYSAFVDIGQRNLNQTYYFGNDSLMERYERSALQAAAVVEFEYSFGKSGNEIIGLRISHAGISPVKETAVYYDGLGNSAVISKQMKAMSIQLSLSAKIRKRKKKETKSD